MMLHKKMYFFVRMNLSAYATYLEFVLKLENLTFFEWTSCRATRSRPFRASMSRVRDARATHLRPAIAIWSHCLRTLQKLASEWSRPSLRRSRLKPSRERAGCATYSSRRTLFLVAANRRAARRTAPRWASNCSALFLAIRKSQSGSKRHARRKRGRRENLHRRVTRE